MAFVASASSTEARANSLGGPLKYEILTYTAASGDIAGTITSKNLHQIYHILQDGLQETALPVIAANVATLAFVDPAATVFGTIIVIGV